MATSLPTPPYTPTNEVYVCADVGFDNTYQHFRYFPDTDERNIYFRRKQIGYHSGLTPFFISEKVMYLPDVADKYINADYLMFRNTDFDDDRWYFAFITQVDFINPKNCRVHFEIDVMQTYFYETTFTPTFVERMHWPTDEIGDNLIADNLELGDYIVNDTAKTHLLDDYCIVVACSVDASGNPAVGGYYGGIYSGLNLLKFTSASSLNDFLTQVASSNQKDAIICIFMMPETFYKEKSTSGDSEPVVEYFTYEAPKRDTLDGYTPKNKKLLTYPYKFLQVSNLSGNSADYHYEYFTELGNIFEIIGDCSPNPTIKLAPTGYNGFSNATNAYDFGLTLNGFPQCSYSTDAYLAWLAQTGSVSALGMTFTGSDIAFASQGLGAAGQLISGNILGAAGSFLGIAQNVAQLNATKSLPPQAAGQTANGAMVAFRAKDFFFSDLSVRAPFARIIDDYWTMYGYPCKQVRALSFRTRQYWNFIKTQGCNTEGTTPGWAKTQIQNIFDNGVTLWHTDSIGNYYLDNKPL